eukprot:TRINITY_DN16747_c0_g1_i1.p2 TRINITY_DN16747_c0_g1~~TRINITY_DN16747_c0_g1_i1.p2  ORF type:complete len:106 (+),score=10.64 TRINITY_DN16747_c0_g1_i1:217-534(+)
MCGIGRFVCTSTGARDMNTHKDGKKTHTKTPAMWTRRQQILEQPAQVYKMCTMVFFGDQDENWIGDKNETMEFAMPRKQHANTEFENLRGVCQRRRVIRAIHNSL